MPYEPAALRKKAHVIECRSSDTPSTETTPASIALILGPAKGLTPSTRKGSDYAKRAAATALPTR
jgi:hypothetical protein